MENDTNLQFLRVTVDDDIVVAGSDATVAQLLALCASGEQSD